MVVNCRNYSMTSVLSPSEEAQLAQTIEMFEVITQSQPQDYQSLEILKEAYSKLGREKDVINTSKRIARAYVQLGQLSSAILEYETILQRAPDDAEVLAALREIESRAGSLPEPPKAIEPAFAPAPGRAEPKAPASTPAQRRVLPREIDDGRKEMRRIFVEGKIIAASDFDSHWKLPELDGPPNGVVEPFIQVIADKKILPIEKSLKVLTDKSRAAFLPLDRYDVDLDLARSFPADTCQRWCVLPFDRMSKTTLVATANPFNRQAALELAEATSNRLVWYLAPPLELIKNIKKAFRI